jgi:uncharacterized protein (TIRG00374 family)
MIVGILLSAILAYLSLRGNDFGLSWTAFEPLISAMSTHRLTVVPDAGHQVRRWGLPLGAWGKWHQIPLFSITSVGFMAHCGHSGPLGELARTFSSPEGAHIKMSAALGTFFVERIFDSLSVFGIFMVALILTPLPPWLVRSSLIFLAITLLILAFIVFMLFRRNTCLALVNPLISRLPGRYARKVNELIHHFIDGFQVITDGKRLLLVALLSPLFWLTDLVTIYLTYQAFNLHLPPVAVCVILIVLMIGIAIPAGPGFVGNWHFFCILGLTLYDVPKSEALSFAILYHFLSIGIIVLLGMIFLPFNRFSLRDLKVNGKP